MRSVSTRLLAPPSARRSETRPPRDPALAQEVSVRRTTDGGQIVVRRVTSSADGVPRTLHIDAVVR